MTPLAGKVAIVTGGGGVGIGQASATALARDGAAVLVADIDEAGAQRVAAALVGKGYLALACGVDVTDENSVRDMVATAVSEYGGVDILHSNVGIGDPEDVEVATLDLAVWNRTLAVNLTGSMLCSKYVLPELLKRGGGTIVITSSLTGMLAEGVRPSYGVSKAALLGLVRNIATRYGKQGIRCVGVAPGVVLTASTLAGLEPEQVNGFARHHVTPRLGVPEDIGDFVAFAASDRAGILTGVTVQLDGGFGVHLPTVADEMGWKA